MYVYFIDGATKTKTKADIVFMVKIEDPPGVFSWSFCWPQKSAAAAASIGIETCQGKVTTLLDSKLICHNNGMYVVGKFSMVIRKRRLGVAQALSSLTSISCIEVDFEYIPITYVFLRANFLFIKFWDWDIPKLQKGGGVLEHFSIIKYFACNDRLNFNFRSKGQIAFTV